MSSGWEQKSANNRTASRYSKNICYWSIIGRQICHQIAVLNFGLNKIWVSLLNWKTFSGVFKRGPILFFLKNNFFRNSYFRYTLIMYATRLGPVHYSTGSVCSVGHRIPAFRLGLHYLMSLSNATLSSNIEINITHSRHFSLVCLLGITKPTTTR